MKFDKSKVCVAGLHEVKEGTKGWFADSVNELEEIATQNSANLRLSKMKGQRDCLYVGVLNTVWRFFYPAPEKQYRPFKTIEELYGLLGKVIVNKHMPHKMIITSVENSSGTLFINNMSVLHLFDNYVFDETGEPVGVEV
jgi:hypothetical protein